MGTGSKDKEAVAMRCPHCGSNMVAGVTNLPFKVRENTIIIVKELPVLQCENCSVYLLEDSVMEQVDKLIEGVDSAAELEVIRYAA